MHCSNVSATAGFTPTTFLRLVSLANLAFFSLRHSTAGMWNGSCPTQSQQSHPQAVDILEFVVDVVSTFSPRLLSAERRMGPGCIQRPPEAQYQDEFYRSCHKCSNGSLVTLSKFGTAKGRVDFYIPSKQWRVELLRDGDRLSQHWGRFSTSGLSLPLSDYIILDWGTKCPILPHPNLPKLYHVIFRDNFKTVSILNNKLECIDGGELRLLAGS